MTEQSKSTTLVRVHMQDSLVAELDANAEEIGETRSVVIRRAVREYLELNTNAGND